MRRKPRRRPVHYAALAYRDGAVFACYPTRKPSERRLKEDGKTVDVDLVCSETQYGCNEFGGWELEQRVRTSDLLTNRMNMRRTVRDLVLPKLADLKATLTDITKRLDRIERALGREDS